MTSLATLINFLEFYLKSIDIGLTLTVLLLHISDGYIVIPVPLFCFICTLIGAMTDLWKNLNLLVIYSSCKVVVPIIFYIQF